MQTKKCIIYTTSKKAHILNFIGWIGYGDNKYWAFPETPTFFDFLFNWLTSRVNPTFMSTCSSYFITWKRIWDTCSTTVGYKHGYRLNPIKQERDIYKYFANWILLVSRVRITQVKSHLLLRIRIKLKFLL